MAVTWVVSFTANFNKSFMGGSPTEDGVASCLVMVAVWCCAAFWGGWQQSLRMLKATAGIALIAGATGAVIIGLASVELIVDSPFAIPLGFTALLTECATHPGFHWLETVLPMALAQLVTMLTLGALYSLAWLVGKLLAKCLRTPSPPVAAD
jgi:hypothetical protein